MNNGQIHTKKDVLVVEASSLEEATEKAIAGDNKVEIARMLKHLDSLSTSVYFLQFIKKIVEPELFKKINILKKSKDQIEVYRAQGFVESLEWVKNIDPFIKIYKAKLLKKKN